MRSSAAIWPSSEFRKACWAGASLALKTVASTIAALEARLTELLWRPTECSGRFFFFVLKGIPEPRNRCCEAGTGPTPEPCSRQIVSQMGKTAEYADRAIRDYFPRGIVLLPLPG